MFDFLYASPNWLIGVIFVGAAVAAAMALMFGLRALLPIRDDKETFDIVLRVMPSLLSLTSFVLAFAIVQANGETARANKVVVDEAAGIAQLDRLLLRIDPALTEASRKALAAYAKSIVIDEWPYMRAGLDGFGHATARARLKAFNDALDLVQHDHPGKAALLNNARLAADQIEDLRDTRLREVHESIPELFWIVILILALMMMSLGAFLRPSFTNIIMAASQAAAIGLLAAFLFMLDHPFRGEGGISPAMLERVLTGLSAG